MSKPVKQSQLKDIASYLWTKVTERTNNLISKWIDLEHTSETYSFENLYNHNDTFKVRNTGSFNNNGTIANGSAWSRIVVPVVSGKTYYIMSKLCETNTETSRILGSSTFVMFSDYNKEQDRGTFLGYYTRRNTVEVNGKNVLRVTVGNNDVKFLGFNISKTITNAEEELMVWESTQPFPESYIENGILDKILVDGEKVALRLDNTNTDLTSTDVNSAIREIDLKLKSEHLIKNIEPAQVDGNNTGLKVTKADGSFFILNWDFNNQQISKTSQGQIRRFVIDPAQGVAPFTMINTNNETDESEIVPPITDSEVVRKFSHIFGVKIEMDKECWLKCEGQQIEHTVTGEQITLPISTVGDYIYLCLGH